MSSAKKRPKPYEVSVVGSFMSQPEPESELQTDTGPQHIPISLIDPSPKQPRRYFDSDKMSQLVASVEKKGILEPLVLRPKAKGRYELVAGERRLRAAKEVGLEKVPCTIHDLTDEEAAEIALLENLQRDDLNPVEETEGILELLSVKLDQPREVIVSYFNAVAHPERGKGATPESPEWKVIKELFEVVGRFTPNSFRTNRLPLLKLPEEILEAIRQGEIEYSKARLISRVKDEPKRAKLLQDAIAENLSRDEIQRQIRALKPPKNNDAVTQTVDRINALSQRVKKSTIWADDKKREQLDRLLKEIESLIE